MGIDEQTPKDTALKINPYLKSHEDIYGGWVIKNKSEQVITDKYCSEKGAWLEIINTFTIKTYTT